MDITSVTAVGKLLLDAFTTGRAAIRDHDKGVGMFKPRLIADTRYFLESLRARTRELIIAFRTGDEEKIKKGFNDFFGALSHLSQRVAAINLNILDIYNPGIASQLALAYGWDSIVADYFDERYLGKENHIGVLENPFSRRQHADRTEKISNQVEEDLIELDDKFRSLNVYGISYETKKSLSELINGRDECISELEQLEKVLGEASSVFAEFLRTNWSPKDLT